MVISFLFLLFFSVSQSVHEINSYANQFIRIKDMLIRSE